MASSRARGAGQRFVQQAVHPALGADAVRRMALDLEPYAVDEAWRLTLVMLRRASTPHHAAAVVGVRAALLDAIEAADPAAFAGWSTTALRCGGHRGPSPTS